MEGRSGRDGAHCFVAIGELRGDRQDALPAFLHAEDALIEAQDHILLPDSKHERSALRAFVKHRPIEQAAFVVKCDDVSIANARPFAHFQVFHDDFRVGK